MSYEKKEDEKKSCETEYQNLFSQDFRYIFNKNKKKIKNIIYIGYYLTLILKLSTLCNLL